jgi:hypothetical protein
MCRSEGEAVPSEPLPEFTAESIHYSEELFMDLVTAVVHNPYTTVLENLCVSAVLYDHQDRIVGGGYIFLSFIPAEQSAGVWIPVASSGNVARVEVYPTLSGLSFLTRSRNCPQAPSRFA